MDYAAVALGAEEAIDAALSGKFAGIAVTTSGSTGVPRVAHIGAQALVASASATHAALSGPGCWLLALPTDRIGGALVLARARLSDAPLTRMPGGPFTAAAFAQATAAIPRGAPRYTALVPTQLHRLLSDPRGREALHEFDAVLVGGAAVHLAGLPANVIGTYGTTETTGGCVYGGLPIGETRIAVRDGLVRIAGPTLADGYADGDDSRFVVDAGTRWFVTSDLGEVGNDGRLRVLGRADDVIVTGGVKVVPGVVEAALAVQPWVEESVVVGVPDAEWGEAVVAIVVPRAGAVVPPLVTVRAELAASLSRAEIPRSVHAVDVLPRLSSGKIDRAEVRRLAASLTEDQGEPWPT